MSPELILCSYSNCRIGGVKCCKDCVSFGASPWSYKTTTCFIWEIRGKPLELYNDYLFHLGDKGKPLQLYKDNLFHLGDKGASLWSSTTTSLREGEMVTPLTLK